MLCDFKIDNSSKPVFIDSYKTNYTTTKEVVETLRNQQEPDIGALIPMVDKATAAYKQCKNRIDAVKKAFAEKCRI
ncbi:MAG: hypothetical protein NTX38_05430 [Methylobacter sp.]|nr:hypothetical protein [Methylobacter sp.]